MFKSVVISVLIFLSGYSLLAQRNLGVGTDKPNPRAILDLNVEDPIVYPQGLLLPRLTTTQRNALGASISSTVLGMSVYDTDDKAFYIWDGLAWNKSGSSLTSILGINGITITQTGNAFTISGPSSQLQFGTPTLGDQSILLLNSNNTITSSGSAFVINNTLFGLNFNDIRFGNTSDGNHGMGFYYFPNKLYAGQDINGPVIYGNTNGALGINNANVPEGIALLWKKLGAGNYAISVNNQNVNDVTASLDVNGNARIRNLSISGSILTVDGLGNLGMGVLPINTNQWISTASNKIFTNSFVGIGTSNPLHELEIYGSGSETGMLISATGAASVTLSGVSNASINFIQPGVGNYAISQNASNDFAILQNGFDKLKFYNTGEVDLLNATEFNVGGGFQIKDDNISKIRGVLYQFPTVAGVNNSYLSNDGSGNLSWQTISGISQWITTTSGIYSNSFVGIGNPNPENPLSIQDLFNGTGRTSTKFDISHSASSGFNKAVQLNYSITGTGGTQQFTGYETNLSGSNNTSNTIGYNAIANLSGTGGITAFNAQIGGTGSGNKLGMNINVNGTGGAINAGLNVNVTGATNNYAALFNGGSVGIGTASPSGLLDVTNVGRSVVLNSATTNNYEDLVKIINSNSLENSGIAFSSNGSFTWNIYSIYNNAGLAIGSVDNGFNAIQIENVSNGPNIVIGDDTYSPGTNTTTIASANFIVNALSGAPSGSVVTVNGFGKLGLGPLANSSQWTTNASNIYYNLGNVGIGNIISPQFKLDVSGGINVSHAKFGEQNPVYIYSGSPGIGFNAYWNASNYIYGAGSSNQYAGILGYNEGLNEFNFTLSQNSGNDGATVGTLINTLKVNINGVGIGTGSGVVPNEKLTVMGNSSVTGIGYFSTIVGSGLSGAAGSVVTVDGLGRLGVGTLAPSSQWVSTTNGIFYNGGNIGIGTNASSAFGIDMLKNMARIKRVSDAAGQNAEFDLSNFAETFTWRFGLRPSDQNNNFNIGYFSGSYFVRMYIDPTTGNTGFGNFTGTPPIPNHRVVVFGNQSTTGTGFFGTIVGSSLSGAAGSVVTVDGAGQLGLGTFAANNWVNIGANSSHNTGGNVGINVGNPINSRLEVAGNNFSTSSSGAEEIVRIGSTDNTALRLGIWMQPSSTADDQYIALNAISSGNRNLLLQSTGGNVGIGTSLPSQKLQVEGNTSVTGIAYLGTIIGNNLTGASGSVVTVDGIGRLGLGTISASPWLNNGSSIYFNTSFVGIGTNIPLNLLHVASSVPGSAAFITSSNSDNSNFVNLFSGKSTANFASIGFRNSGDLSFGTLTSPNNEASYIELARITNSGNLGLGTNSPNQRLTLIGNISSTGIGYFGTIIGNNLNGASGSIVTVDGAGRLGIGTLNVISSQWNTVSSNQIFTNSFVGIGNSSPAYLLDIKDVNTANAAYNSINYDITHGGNTGVKQGLIFNYSVAGTGSAINRAMVLNVNGNTTSTNGASGYVVSLSTAGSGPVSAFVASVPSASTGNKTGAFIQVNGSGGPKNVGVDVSVSNGALNYSGLFNGGNFGIGNTAPTAQLHVTGDIRLENFSVAGSVLTVDGAGNLGMGSIPSQTNYWLPNGSDKIYSTSFVGIGNTNPAYPLHIYADENTDIASVIRKTVVSTTTGNQIGLSTQFVGAPASGSKIGLQAFVIAAGIESIRGVSTDIRGGTGNGGTQYRGLDTYIENNGIGTSQGAYITMDGTGTGTPAGVFVTVSSSGAAERYGVRSFVTGGGAGVNYAIFGSASNSTTPGANYAGYFENGNVYVQDNLGVGNSFPTAKFDVTGTIRLRNLNVAGSVLTVDGLGNVGMGSLGLSSQWTTTTAGAIFYNSGNVGIGNDNPAFPFQVGSAAGSATLARFEGVVSARINSNSATQEVLNLANLNGLSNAVVAIDFNSLNSVATLRTGSKVVSFLSDNTTGLEKGQFAIQTMNNGTLEEKIRVNSTGLGININSPTAMLDVNGNARIRNLSIAGAFLTVDGLGNLGLGTLASSTNYFTFTGGNIQTLNNSDNIKLASISGAYLIGNNTALKMNDFNNVFMGNMAGNLTVTGDNNFVFGDGAGVALTVGRFNNFLGQSTGAANTSGERNNFFGWSAGSKTQSGSANNFFGNNAGFNNVNGSNNNYIGNAAGVNISNGSDNNIIGNAAGSNSNGSRNNFIGNNAGLVVNGSDNNFFGSNAGSKITSGSNNIAIGNNADFSPLNIDNSIAIGSNTTITGSNQVIIGNAITGLGINTSPTAMLDVNGNARIRNLSIAGSVVTDAQGNLSVSTISGSSQWISTTNGVYITSSVGIGSSPSSGAILMITDDQGNANVGLYNIGASSQAGNFLIGRARGTISAKTPVQANDYLGTYGFAGFDGTNLASDGPNAEISVQAPSLFSTSNYGTDMIFKTTKVNTTVTVERMRISNDGTININTTGGSSMLNIVAPANSSGLYVSGSPLTNTGVAYFETNSPQTAAIFAQSNASQSLAIYAVGNGVNGTGLQAEGINGADAAAIQNSSTGRGLRLDMKNISSSATGLNIWMNSTVNGTNAIEIQGNVGVRIEKLGNSGGGVVYADGGGNLYTSTIPGGGSNIWTVSGTNVSLMNTTNRVGIGTQFPNGKLDILNDDANAPALNIISQTSTGFNLNYGGTGTGANFFSNKPTANTINISGQTNAFNGALSVSNNGSGPSIFALNNGSGYAAKFETENANAALSVQSNNTGGGLAASFYNYNTTSTGSVVTINNNSTNGSSGGLSINMSSNTLLGLVLNGRFNINGFSSNHNSGAVYPVAVDPSGTFYVNTTIGTNNVWSVSGGNIFNNPGNANVVINNVSSSGTSLQVNGEVGLGDGVETNNKPIVVWLRNAGGAAASGDIVIVGGGNDSFTTTNTASQLSAIGVLTQPCASSSVCKVAISGIVNVNVAGTAVLGQHCVTSVTPGQALSVPTPTAGASIGVFIQGGSGSVRVLLR